MTFSGVVSRNTSPTTSLPSAVTSLNATGTTLGAPLAQVASVCPICQEALSDEESAEAPPAAEEARRFRGSVLTAGRGSGWEPADTTVSAEEHAKKSPPKWVVIYGAGDEESAEAPPAAEEARRFRGSVLTAGRGSGWEPADTTVSAEEHAKKSPPKWVVIYGAGDEESAEAPPAAEEARRFRGSVLTAGRGSGWEPADTTVSAEEHAKKSPPKWVVIYVITHRFCCSHPRISQGRGSVRGKPLRVSPLAFNHPPAGDHFCAAKVPLQKRRDTHSCVSSFLERATRLELATSTLARSRSTR